MIKLGLSQNDRLIKLNEAANRQLELLKNDKRIKELEIIQKDVNKELLEIGNE